MARDRWRGYAKVISEVVEDNKSVIWLVGSLSSALGGWAVYSLRRLHYAKIEGNMESISAKIEELERTGSRRMSQEHWLVSPFRVSMIAIPAATSAFLLGYLAGRTSANFAWRQQVQRTKALSKQRRVYLAVIPEESFEAHRLGQALERAVQQKAEAEAAKAKKRWWR
mmetsp:Transcript_55347/g.132041  ORF Transcript_55347/g.132041 Transcript_55347/m.132041 type:complete len:168 (+) Transcript_55347:2-505(+)